MQQTQVVREIIEVAKGMLPESQQSTQNIKSIEEMARNLVAQKSFGSTKKEVSEMEELKKRTNEKVKDEKNFIQQSNMNSSKEIFYEKYEAICSDAFLLKNCSKCNIENKTVLKQSSQMNNFTKPHVCVIGMQGSGKSELIEALIGIPFAYVNNGIATTVPIIIETIYNREIDCKCSFAVSRKGNLPNKFDEMSFDQIAKKVENVCEGNKFINKDDEIYIKIVSKRVTPLIYVDLPGFKDVENEINEGNEEIQKMQKRIEKIWEKYLLQENNLILCVERATMERDDNYSQKWLMEEKGIKNNIVIVASHLDAKLVQCKDKDDLHDYLDEASDGYKHFYVSFLNKRGLSVKGYNDQMEDKHIDDVKKLVSLGLEDKYFESMGVWKLKEYIRERMIGEYSNTISCVHSDIMTQIEETQKEIDQLQTEMNNKLDEDAIRRSIQQCVSSLGNVIVQLITGECTVSPKEHGETLAEERKKVECDKWPGIGNDITIVGNQMKLYGGAQYERLLREVEAALLTIELPVPSEDEVFVAMGIHAIGGMLNGGERVINVVIKTKAAETLTPIIDILTKRIVHIFGRLFEISLSLVQRILPDKEMIKNEMIQTTLKQFYVEFIQKRLNEVEKMLKDDMFSFVNVIDWDMLTSVPMEIEEIKESKETNVFETNEDEEQSKESEEEHHKKIKERVEKIMVEKQKNEMKIIQQLRNINGMNSHKDICIICQKVFNAVRESFWRNTRSKLNAYFLQPMIGELKEEFSRETQVVFTKILSTFKSKEEQQKEIDDVIKRKNDFGLIVDQCEELRNLLTSFTSHSQQFDVPVFKKVPSK